MASASTTSRQQSRRKNPGRAVVEKDGLKKLGDELSEGLVQDLGEGPCPTCSKPAKRVRILRKVFQMACEACAQIADEDEAAKERAERVEGMLQRGGITAVLAQWSFETYPKDAQSKEALAKVKAWLREDPLPNLILYGPIGTGKSGLAWSAVRELIETRLVPARFVNYLDYLEALRQSYGGAKSPPELDRCPVLVIDDLGAERPTEWAAEQTGMLVERRSRNGLTTVVTSNYPLSELARRLSPNGDSIVGQRIVSRLAQGAIKVHVDGRDRRVEAA